MNKIYCDKCEKDLSEIKTIKKFFFIYPKNVENEHYVIWGFEEKVHLCRDCAKKLKLWLKN